MPFTKLFAIQWIKTCAICIFCVFLSANLVKANEVITHVLDKKIVMVTGLAKPPFILENADKGIQLDIVRAAFATQHIHVDFVRAPLARNITEYRMIRADGVITVTEDYKDNSFFISIPYVNYQNVAVSLSDKNLTINSIFDLSDKSIAAFQNAKKFLGDDYQQAVRFSLAYREIAEQSEQIAMLFSGEKEVIILDKYIITYFLKQSADEMYNKPYTFHAIFDEKQYSAGFRKAEIKEYFDKGIDIIKENGTYDDIIQQYLGNL